MASPRGGDTENARNTLLRYSSIILILVLVVSCTTQRHDTNRRDVDRPTVTAGKPRAIEKLGTIECDLMETTPVIFRGRLYRLEYRRAKSPRNPADESLQHFVDVETGETTAPFAHGFHFSSAFVAGDTVYVYGVKEGNGPNIYVFWTQDFRRWSFQPALEMPGWGLFNSSVCRGPEGYIMAFEVGNPPEMTGTPFTAYFAESDDLLDWRFLGTERVFTREHYNACPTLRYVNGYYYLLYLANVSSGGETEYATHIARSTDLIHWEKSPRNPVLRRSQEDHRIYNAALSPTEQKRIANAVNINNSDIDLCEYKGEVLIYYSWGNQNYVEHLAQARFDGSLEELLESFFLQPSVVNPPR